MLNHREINLIIDALLCRMNNLKEADPETYDECKLLLAKLWQMRRDAHLAAIEPSQSPIST